MSREGTVSPQGVPQSWPQPATTSGWWQPFRINLLILRNNFRWLLLIVLLFLLAIAGLYEARTSALEARIFSAVAARLSYSIDSGPSQRIVFPTGGPFNEVRGYVGLPAFEHRLMDAGFHVVAQARLSSALEHWNTLLVGESLPRSMNPL
jgi:hypothetical protein